MVIIVLKVKGKSMIQHFYSKHMVQNFLLQDLTKKFSFLICIYVSTYLLELL